MNRNVAETLATFGRARCRVFAAVFNRALDEDADTLAVAEEAGVSMDSVLTIFSAVLEAARLTDD